MNDTESEQKTVSSERCASEKKLVTCTPVSHSMPRNCALCLKQASSEEEKVWVHTSCLPTQSLTRDSATNRKQAIVTEKKTLIAFTDQEIVWEIHTTQ